jgi:hypothetical protein
VLLIFIHFLQYGDYPSLAYGYGAPSYPPGYVGTGYGSTDQYSAGPPAGAYAAVQREMAPAAPSLYGDHSLEELYSHGQVRSRPNGRALTRALNAHWRSGTAIRDDEW